MNEQKVYPTFVFGRRRDIEREGGYLLAGQLVVDLPKGAKLKRRQQQMIDEIVEGLLRNARSGQMPDYDFVAGWPGGAKPPNAVDAKDDALMTAWSKDRLIIALRVGPRRDDGMIAVDSDLMRQMKLYD